MMMSTAIASSAIPYLGPLNISVSFCEDGVADQAIAVTVNQAPGRASDPLRCGSPDSHFFNSFPDRSGKWSRRSAPKPGRRSHLIRAFPLFSPAIPPPLIKLSIRARDQLWLIKILSWLIN